MPRSEFSHHFSRVHDIPPKCWKIAGLVAVSVISAKVIVKLVKRRNRRLKIKGKQDELREAKARLKQQLQNDQITKEKSEKITRLSITELQAKLQKDELKAVDVLKAYQFKALEVNESTNCIVEPIVEAEAWARDLDKMKGPKGLLHGIPFSIKESYNLKGYDVTAGLSYFIHRPVDNDAVLVKAIKDAGGIPFVRTNIPQTMYTYECSNPIYGVTTNPHDASRCPGGSSGGEGAIIGGGGSIVGIGSDIGGSIRIPSHMCGIAGLKPTVQRLSGSNTFHDTDGQRNVLPSVGPMARSVDGVVLAMKAFLSESMFTSDNYIPPLPFNNQVYESKKPLRIGYYTYDNVIHPVPACVRAVKEAKTALEKLGHTLVPFTPPDVDKALPFLFVTSVFGDNCYEMGKYLKNDEIDKTFFLNYHLYQTIPRGLKKLLAYIVRIKDRVAGDILLNNGVLYTQDWWNLATKISLYKNKVTQKWKDENLDAVLSPGFGCTALPSYKSAEVSTVLSYTTIWNLLNFPAGSVRVTNVDQQDQSDLNNTEVYPAQSFIERELKKLCTDSVGLPVNVQCIALPFQEEVVLRLMKEIEFNV
ncbi:hypothetical protein LOTGIDRAFT_237604 [Lottia gigantea]|uniref:fatty acid amide hydrolase n=1 Tax=Lottia gigantea TaxID=225164 RepID=V4B0I2_LOTGI|nr:hypothetical protein LOTGIDRAFT_237604 [Lottia gigantea]ESP03598.1 hypothetical protein LOTGIDRAFT_237604 [Lottia gigantea]